MEKYKGYEWHKCYYKGRYKAVSGIKYEAHVWGSTAAVWEVVWKYEWEWGYSISVIMRVV